jgi:hypothetical protein
MRLGMKHNTDNRLFDGFPNWRLTSLQNLAKQQLEVPEKA